MTTIIYNTKTPSLSLQFANVTAARASAIADDKNTIMFESPADLAKMSLAKLCPIYNEFAKNPVKRLRDRSVDEVAELIWDMMESKIAHAALNKAANEALSTLPPQVDKKKLVEKLQSIKENNVPKKKTASKKTASKKAVPIVSKKAAAAVTKKKTASKKATASRPTSMKSRLRALFEQDTSRTFTMKELVEKLRSTKTTISGTISDLKNPKYCGPDGTFFVSRDSETGDYSCGE